MTKKTTKPKLTAAEKEERYKQNLYKTIIKRKAKQLNDRYRDLEKQGLETRSQSYQTVEHYAVSDPKGEGKMYKLDYDKGTLRFSADVRGWTSEQMSDYIDKLNQVLAHKTSTVRGTTKAIETAYETAKKQYQFEGTKEEYEKIWKAYKDNVQPDRRVKLDSETVMSIMENSNIYELSREDMDEAMRYIFNSETKDESEMKISSIQEAMSIYDFSDNYEEAAEKLKEAGYSDIVKMFSVKFAAIQEYFK